jgi:hypothetical protein
VASPAAAPSVNGAAALTRTPSRAYERLRRAPPATLVPPTTPAPYTKASLEPPPQPAPEPEPEPEPEGQLEERSSSRGAAGLRAVQATVRARIVLSEPRPITAREVSKCCCSSCHHTGGTLLRLLSSCTSTLGSFVAGAVNQPFLGGVAITLLVGAAATFNQVRAMSAKWFVLTSHVAAWFRIPLLAIPLVILALLMAPERCGKPPLVVMRSHFNANNAPFAKTGLGQTLGQFVILKKEAFFCRLLPRGVLPWSHSLVSWIFRLRFSARRILRRQLWLCTFYGLLATISALTWVYTVLLRYLVFGSAQDATPPQCTAGEGSTGFIHRSSVLSRVTECEVALDRYEKKGASCCGRNEQFLFNLSRQARDIHEESLDQNWKRAFFLLSRVGGRWKRRA